MEFSADNSELFAGSYLELTVSVDSFLFAPSADKTLRQFGRSDHKRVRSYGGHSDWVLSTACHPASGRLAAGCFDGSVRVWDSNDGNLIVDFVAAPGR